MKDFIVQGNGIPVAPDHIQAILAEINPRLTLRFIDGAVSYWTICERWQDNDPRRERIRNGEIDPKGDFDVRAFLPRGCSPEEVEGYIARNFVRVTDPEKQAQEAIEQTTRQNKAVQDKLKDDFLQVQDDKAARTTSHELSVQLGRDTANAQIIVPANVGTGKQRRASNK